MRCARRVWNCNPYPPELCILRTNLCSPEGVLIFAGSHLDGDRPSPSCPDLGPDGLRYRVKDRRPCVVVHARVGVRTVIRKCVTGVFSNDRGSLHTCGGGPDRQLVTFEATHSPLGSQKSTCVVDTDISCGQRLVHLEDDAARLHENEDLPCGKPAQKIVPLRHGNPITR